MVQYPGWVGWVTSQSCSSLLRQESCLQIIMYFMIQNYCLHLFQVSIETLKLFEALLDKPCEIIFNNLVLRNLRSRKYYCAPVVTNGGAASNGPMTENLLIPPPPSTPPLTPDGLESPQIVDDIDREEVEQVVNR